MNENNKKEIDHISGVETTGHEWDGLKELNNPLPRWWVWVFLVCCIWSIWYWVVYPSWPTLSGATNGIGGYTQFKELEEGQQKILARQQQYLNKFQNASFEQVMQDQELYNFAVAGGNAAFKENCATCHGTGAEGSKGYPNLNDDDWLWGGTINDIYITLQHGIRSGDEETRVSQMPAFGKEKILTRDEINDVVDYVVGLSEEKKRSGFEKGSVIFQQQCAACHGLDAKGNQQLGSPNLSDKIWLYGGDRKTVYETVFNSRAGVMPVWKDRLDDSTLRQLTVYVHELGGGAEDSNVEETSKTE